MQARNAYIFPERVFIPQVTGKLGPDAGLTDAGIDERLGQQAEGFARFAYAFAPTL